MTAHIRTNRFVASFIRTSSILLFAGAVQLLVADASRAQPQPIAPRADSSRDANAQRPPVRFEAFGPLRTATAKEDVSPSLELTPNASQPEHDGAIAEIQAIRNRLGIDPLKGTTLEHIEVGEDAGFNAALKIISSSTPREPTRKMASTTLPSLPPAIQAGDWRADLRDQARGLELIANRVEDEGDIARADRLRKTARRLRKEAVLTD